MNDTLDAINRIRGVGGCLMLSSDGLAIASALRTDIDEDALSASLADMVARCFRLCTEAKIDKPRLLHTHSDQGGVVLMAAGPGYLALIIDPNANLALLHLEVRPFIESIAEQLSL